MTQIPITVDTELSALLHQRGLSADHNLRLSVTGPYGVDWQMDWLERHGLKGVYFVDPMPGLVYGSEIIARIVAPIVARRHEVQLHIHTEWLEWAKQSPVEGRQGRNIGDFALEDQVALIASARDALITAGAPTPIAFRAGNYGANDDSLKALAALGLQWDCSFNAYYSGMDCRIGLDQSHIDPVRLHGINEVPVATIEDRPGQIRPAQVCALSSAEMRAGLRHAADTGRPAFSIVTHSFEMLSRDRMRPNRLVMRRFGSLCREVARHPDLEGAGFADLDPGMVSKEAAGSRLGPSRVRTLSRVAQQAFGTIAYDWQLRPT
jgi:hypothetical protein